MHGRVFDSRRIGFDIGITVVYYKGLSILVPHQCK
jgi:hypothetical protein